MEEVKKIFFGLVVLLFLAYVIAFADYPFQKGGPGNFDYQAIIEFSCVIGVLLTAQFNGIRLWEKLLLSFVCSGIALCCSSLIFMRFVEEMMVGDKTWLFWELKYSLIANSIYYSGTTFLTFFLIKRYAIKYRGSGYS